MAGFSWSAVASHLRLDLGTDFTQLLINYMRQNVYKQLYIQYFISFSNSAYYILQDIGGGKLALANFTEVYVYKNHWWFSIPHKEGNTKGKKV